MTDRIKMLSLEDKAYMSFRLFNKNFPLDVLSKIYPIRETIQGDALCFLGMGKIGKIAPKKEEFLEVYKNMPIDIADTAESILMNPMYDRDNVIHVFDLLQNNVYNKALLTNSITYTDIKIKMEEFTAGLFGYIIPYKLKAYSIRKKLMDDDFSHEDPLKNLMYNSVTTYISEFISTNDVNVTALMYYLLMRELEVQDKFKYKELFSSILFMLNKSFSAEFESLCNMISGDADFSLTDVIDRVSTSCSLQPDTMELVKSCQKMQFIPNGYKNQGSEDYSSFGVTLQDEGFELKDDNDVQRILMSVKGMDEELIKDYVGEGVISYTFGENEIGCLRFSMKIPMLICNNKAGYTRMIIQYEGNNFLLINKVGDPKIYGLGIDTSASDGTRKLFILEPDKRFEYKLQS